MLQTNYGNIDGFVTGLYVRIDSEHLYVNVSSWLDLL